MARLLKERKKSQGLPPGSLVYIGKYNKPVPIQFFLTNYTKDVIHNSVEDSLEDCVRAARDRSKTSWLDVQGLSDSKRIDDIGKQFGIDKLWLEDVLNTDHRPKMEELDDLLFMIVKSVHLNADYTIEYEQISIFKGDSFVISFQEQKQDIFNSVRDRLEKSVGKLRAAKADYLFYALIDCVVDNYFGVLESLGSRIDQYEKEIIKDVESFDPNVVIKTKNEIINLKRSTIPIRDAISKIIKSKQGDIQKDNFKYFQDILDNTYQIIDVIDGYREMLNGLMSSYQNNMNIKNNEVVKTLTIYASIFIPLTFVVGIYGMNFEHMPELKWQYGYHMIWAVMLILSGGMLIYFKRKKWF